MLGKKYFPCIYAKNKRETHSTNNCGFGNDEVEIERIKSISNNYTFPVISIQNNFDENECRLLLEKILKEVEKESNDEFPYNLKFLPNLQLNFWLKHFKNIYISNIVMFLLIIVIFIITISDILIH